MDDLLFKPLPEAPAAPEMNYGYYATQESLSDLQSNVTVTEIHENMNEEQSEYKHKSILQSPKAPLTKIYEYIIYGFFRKHVINKSNDSNHSMMQSIPKEIVSLLIVYFDSFSYFKSAILDTIPDMKLLYFALSQKMNVLRANEFKSIYHTKQHGFDGDTFHKQCDVGPTITIIKNDKNYIFGGYTTMPWKQDKIGRHHGDPDSFIFYIKSKYDKETEPFIADKYYKNTSLAVCHCSVRVGPWFGSEDLVVRLASYGNTGMAGKATCEPHVYQFKAKQLCGYDKGKYFQIAEMEILHVVQ